MKRLSLVMLLLLLSFIGFSQVNRYHTDCDPASFCNDCGDTKAEYNSHLIKYFEKQVNWAIMSRVSGVVVVRVLVDSTGTPCAYGFYNHSTVDKQGIRDLELDGIIQKMEKWKPAIVDGQPVNASVLLAIYSRVLKHRIFDVNYLRNDKDRKWVVSSSDGRKPVTNYDDINDITD